MSFQTSTQVGNLKLERVLVRSLDTFQGYGSFHFVEPNDGYYLWVVLFSRTEFAYPHGMAEAVTSLAFPGMSKDKIQDIARQLGFKSRSPLLIFSGVGSSFRAEEIDTIHGLSKTYEATKGGSWNILMEVTECRPESPT